MSETPREDEEPAVAEPAVEGSAVELPGDDAPPPPATTKVTSAPDMPPSPAAPTRANAPVIPPAAPTRANAPVIPPAASTRANAPVIPPAAPTRVNAPVTRPAASMPPAPATSTGEAVGSAFDGHAPEPAMNPLGDIAADRPEILVGAAFAAGVLAAMILRRLGS